MMPEFTAAQARSDQVAQARMLVALIGAALLAALPLRAADRLGGDWLLARWTGGAIIAPPGLMSAIALSVALGGLWTPLSAMMLAIGRQGAFVWAYLLIGIASVGGTYWLAQTLGATGAALAVAALDLCMCVVVGSFAYRHWWRGFPTGPAARAMWARGRAVLRR
jgi:O-antigen/teichoic acid export membrane protein